MNFASSKQCVCGDRLTDPRRVLRVRAPSEGNKHGQKPPVQPRRADRKVRLGGVPHLCPHARRLRLHRHLLLVEGTKEQRGIPHGRPEHGAHAGGSVAPCQVGVRIFGPFGPDPNSGQTDSELDSNVSADKKVYRVSMIYTIENENMITRTKFRM